ncbi:MAG: response regulator, partial [Cytophagaceae bacterium]
EIGKKPKNKTIDSSKRLEGFKGQKILIVEDNPMNKLVVESFLKKHDLNIDYAENGKESLKITEEKVFDLILMDLQMPVMDGYEASYHIRNDNSNKNNKTPIIALTASPIVEIKKKALSSGINDFISKPFDPDFFYKKLLQYILAEQISETAQRKIALMDTGKQQKVTDLNYLKDASGGNNKFIREMVEVFLKQTPDALESAKKHLDDNQWDPFRKAVHKTKPTIAMMGIYSLTEDIRTIEAMAKKEDDKPKIEELLLKVKKTCESAYVELKKELKDLN